MKTKIPALLVLTVSLALSGCGRGSRAESSQPDQAVEKVTNVTVRPVTPEDLQEVFTLPGTLEAWEDLTLAAELAGAVRWIGPQEGARLRPGEALLRIDPETQEANLARAEAEFELRQKQLERIRQLVEQKFASQQELDDARRAFEVAAAELQSSRVALKKSSLKSPVGGVLDRLLVDRGEYVNPGTPVAVVVQVDRLKVLTDVPEKDVPFLRIGQEIEVLPAAIDGRSAPPLAGEIIHLSYKADPATRTYLAKVAVDNRTGALRPGMIVRVRFVRRSLRQVVAVPLYALLDRADTKVVFVEEKGVARMRPVQTGPVVGDKVVIREGLEPGERLIVKGQQLVTDGSRVAAEG